MEVKNKTILVLFSGGLDSTYLVYKNLKDGNYVKPIYVELGNNREKSIIEKIQTEKLIRIFNEEFNDRLQDIIKPIKLVVNSGAPELLFKQMPLWITSIIYSDELSYVDEIHIGYVMNDDAISYLEDIRKIYYSYQGIIHKKLPKLLFPLYKLGKDTISNRLPEKYKELTISCEFPKLALSGDGVRHFDCGSCSPCKRAVRLNRHPDMLDDDKLTLKPALEVNIHSSKLPE